MHKPTTGERLFDIANIACMLLLIFFTLYPFWYVLVGSLGDAVWVTGQRGLLWFPYGFNLEAYKAVFLNPMILSGYLNTLFIVVVGTSLNMIMTAFGAYALSRRNLLLKNPLMFLIVFTMFFNGGLIPFYLIVSGLGLIDSIWALIVPGAISTFNLIIMRTTFQAVPVSLEESAKLEGANDFVVLFRIVLPLSIPVVAVLILFYGVAHWNSWFSALIFIRSRDLYPLQLILREILITNNTEQMITGVTGDNKIMIGATIKYAAIIVATGPILLLYPFLQKYFVKGVMIGAIKE